MEWAGHEKIHPQYSITYDKMVFLYHTAVHIGAIVISDRTLMQMLPVQYYKFMILIDPEQSERLPDNQD